jgi:paraquat-inducible protein A
VILIKNPTKPETSNFDTTVYTRNLRFLVYLATLLFVVGIFAPMLTISQLIVISSTFSVFSGVVELLISGQYLLFLVVTGFSLVLPLMKLWVLFRLTSRHPMTGPKLKRTLSLMHEYGRWAMLDVLVVAVLIVTVKLGTIASLQIHYGLYVFGASVLLIMLLTGRVMKLSD